MKFQVLVVDDEEGIGRTMRRLLRRHGVDAELAVNGRDGLDVLLECDGAMHAVVTDHRMPQMTGVELLHEVRSRWPRMRRVLMTGYLDDEPIPRAEADGVIQLLLSKPWSADDLASFVNWLSDEEAE